MAVMGVSTWRKRALAAVALAIASLLLASCSGNVVRPPDCLDCRPVTMTTGQVLEVELGGDLSLGRPQDPEAYKWVLIDRGSMELVTEKHVRRSEDPDEFIGGYSYSTIWTFKPTTTGATQLRFHLVKADDPETVVPGSGPATIDVEIPG